jgi:hypothetical protein
MSLINQCSMFINRYLPFITASMDIRGEKLGGGPANRPVDMLGIMTGALFLRSSRVRPTMLVQHEKLLYAHYVSYIWSRIVLDLSVGCV